MGWDGFHNVYSWVLPTSDFNIKLENLSAEDHRGQKARIKSVSYSLLTIISKNESSTGHISKMQIGKGNKVEDHLFSIRTIYQLYSDLLT
jgi:hypothetical protein